MSLSTKLIAAIVLLLVAAVGTAGFYSYRSMQDFGAEETARSRNAGEENIKRQAQLMTRNLATSAAPALAEFNTSLLSSLADVALKEDPRIEWLVIIYQNADGARAVATAGKAPIRAGEAFSDELAERLRTGKGAEVLDRVDPADATHIRFGANVRFGDEIVGQVHLAMSTKDLQQQVEAAVVASGDRARQAAQKLAIVAGIIILLGILIGMQQSVRIARPLRALALQARRIAGGDFQHRVNVRTKDEIGQLGEAFNTMADGLGVLLQEMAGKASMERELQLARSVQELMSPPPEPIEVSGFVLAGHCETATQCGGDWWSYRRLSPDRVLVLIGDVTGHGVPAAMIAATARGAVEALSFVEESRVTPALVLEAIDRAIREIGSTKLLMTCFAMVVDSRERTVHYANAGHVFPYVGNASDGPLTELRSLAIPGNPLGTSVKHVREARAELVPGEVIILTTDGLVDRISGSGERFGDRRMRRFLQKRAFGGDAAAYRDRLVAEVREFAADCPADDDITLVVVSFPGVEVPLAAAGG